MANTHIQGPNWVDNVKQKGWGGIPTSDDSSIDTTLSEWKKLRSSLELSQKGGQTFDNNGVGGVVSTYSLIYTTTNAYYGGVLAPNGDIHFVPYGATVGQKISASGNVSTYSLLNSVGLKSLGGVLAPNGDIHFVPYSANRGQKVSPSGVVSTYSLAYTTAGSYDGGVLAPNGDIHFIPSNAQKGQKVSSSGIVSTYNLIYVAFFSSIDLGYYSAYSGGVLAPNGDIHFVPYYAPVGQKISIDGTVSTYSLVYTAVLIEGVEAFPAYSGGVLAPNGDIHFVPYYAPVGQKISIDGTVSTYSLVYTASPAYSGGVLAPNGDIHFIPISANRGQKVSASGVVSTYSLAYTTTFAYHGGVLAPNGDIQFVPRSANRGQKISTLPATPIDQSICQSSFLNKF
jgi:hypothetical protein